MSKLKKFIYENKALSKTVIPVYLATKRRGGFSSKKYWENRYKKGGNSGAGSYGRLAKFKAEFLNDFVRKNSIKTVMEFGVGDGNQAKLFKFPNYIGLDVSPTSIKNCIESFKGDKSKSFFLYDPACFSDNQNVFSVDLSMSIDVIYHLVEDEVFEKYMRDLFATAKKRVVIYSSDFEDAALSRAQHVNHRKFTAWVDKNIKDWKLADKTENKYALHKNQIDQSFADFFIYEKAR